MMLALAKRNGVEMPYASVEDVRAAYEFDDLQSFLDLYYLGMSVLIEERDFHDLCFAYLERVKADNVAHVEIFFDPQAHTERGVSPVCQPPPPHKGRTAFGRKKCGRDWCQPNSAAPLPLLPAAATLLPPTARLSPLSRSTGPRPRL